MSKGIAPVQTRLDLNVDLQAAVYEYINSGFSKAEVARRLLIAGYLAETAQAAPGRDPGHNLGQPPQAETKAPQESPGRRKITLDL